MGKKSAETPAPPYYAVIFTSVSTGERQGEYVAMDNQMVVLAKQQDGFLGLESARQELGISISYWRDLAAIMAWKKRAEHVIAQKKGRAYWYAHYKVRVAKVEKEYCFDRIVD